MGRPARRRPTSWRRSAVATLPRSVTWPDHVRRLYRAARGRTSASGRGDPVQDVFVTFVATLDRFEGRATVHTWLFDTPQKVAGSVVGRGCMRCTIRLTTSGRQASMRLATGLDRPARPRAAPLSKRKGAAEAIENCLPGLTDAQREVFHLRMVEALSAADVGKILGLTVTGGVTLHRARLRMRHCLSRKGWEGGRIVMMTCRDVSTSVVPAGGRSAPDEPAADSHAPGDVWQLSPLLETGPGNRPRASRCRGPSGLRGARRPRSIRCRCPDDRAGTPLSERRARQRTWP